MAWEKVVQRIGWGCCPKCRGRGFDYQEGANPHDDENAAVQCPNCGWKGMLRELGIIPEPGPMRRRPYNPSSYEPMSSELEAIKALLLHEWDPIRVSDVIQARDEYDAYASQVYRMVCDGCDATAIASYLNWVVTSRMSLPGNLDKDRVIAAKAIAIHELGDR